MENPCQYCNVYNKQCGRCFDCITWLLWVTDRLDTHSVGKWGY